MGIENINYLQGDNMPTPDDEAKTEAHTSEEIHHEPPVEVSEDQSSAGAVDHPDDEGVESAADSEVDSLVEGVSTDAPVLDGESNDESQ